MVLFLCCCLSEYPIIRHSGYSDFAPPSGFRTWTQNPSTTIRGETQSCGTVTWQSFAFTKTSLRKRNEPREKSLGVMRHGRAHHVVSEAAPCSLCFHKRLKVGWTGGHGGWASTSIQKRQTQKNRNRGSVVNKPFKQYQSLATAAWKPYVTWV